MKTYALAEIFYSLQGEGCRAGTANVFVRFAGCNLQCAKAVEGFDCDTDFSMKMRMTAEELIEAVRKEGGACRWIILTGGEPTLQVDEVFIDLLHQAGYQVAMESNGILSAPNNLDWLTVSPKNGHPITQMRCNEIKYVMPVGEPLPSFPAELVCGNFLLSPAFNGASLELDRHALDYCIELVRRNPKWRLSVQQHKSWRVR